MLKSFITPRFRYVIVAAGLLATTTLLLLPSPASAQGGIPPFSERPDLYAQLEDGWRFFRVRQAGDTLPAELFTAGYRFEMVSDPDTTCETQYVITGFKRNGKRLPLRNWENRRTVNVGEHVLGFNSRTIDITLNAGDTLSFYREFSWRDPRTNYQDSNNYRSLDTLSYTVELVRSTDSLRIALLDSLGVLPSVAAGVPAIHGTRPIMALVAFIVPASMNNVTAFLRVRPRAHGTGEYNFTRTEMASIGLWLRLQDAQWINYLVQWGQVYGKPSVSGQRPDGESHTELSVHTDGGSGRHALIEFSTAPDGGPTAVVVHDINGRLLFYPYTSPASGRELGHATYRFDAAGTYLISLLHDGRYVKTVSIIVGR